MKRLLQTLSLALFPWVILPPPFTFWPDREGVWIAPKVFYLAFLALLFIPRPPAGERTCPPGRGLLLGILAWLGVASLAALPPFLSQQDWSTWLLGPLNRMDGPLYQLFLLAFALGLSHALAKDPRLAGGLIPAMLLFALFQGILWLWQRGGLDPLAGVVGYTPGLPPGTVGNPGMAAGLALPLVPLALALWLGRREGVWLLAALGLATALGGLANRSALIALALALGVWVILSRDRRLALASLGALGLAYASSAYWPSTLPVQKEIASGRTLETRLEMWRLGLSLLQEPKTFLFGLGPLGSRRRGGREGGGQAASQAFPPGVRVAAPGEAGLRYPPLEARRPPHVPGLPPQVRGEGPSGLLQGGVSRPTAPQQPRQGPQRLPGQGPGLRRALRPPLDLFLFGPVPACFAGKTPGARGWRWVCWALASTTWPGSPRPKPSLALRPGHPGVEGHEPTSTTWGA